VQAILKAAEIYNEAGLHEKGERSGPLGSVALDALPALSIEREALWRRVGEADFLSADEKRAAVGVDPAGR